MVPKIFFLTEIIRRITKIIILEEPLKIWKTLLLCTFLLSLLTGCVTSRYTEPNLTISPEFTELKDTRKSMQIIIEDPEGIYISTSKGLMSDARGGGPRAYFQELFEKYFDWHIRDISNLKRVEFYKPEDTRKYDYTLYLSYIGFFPYYITEFNPGSTNFTNGQFLTTPASTSITEVEFDYDLIYRVEDNKTGEIVMFNWYDHNESSFELSSLFKPAGSTVDVEGYEENSGKMFVPSFFLSVNGTTIWLDLLNQNSEKRKKRGKVSNKKYEYNSNDVLKKKQWKTGIRNLAKKVILNTPFYSKEEEEKNENKFYDFNNKTNFHKKPSFF